MRRRGRGGWVHPRAGGEHSCISPSATSAAGSSPRGRGTPRHEPLHRRGGRFIPARAGNTRNRSFRSESLPVHPRAGGEHRSSCHWRFASAGSSPRGRGTRYRALRHEQPGRFIPARAGNTRTRTLRHNSITVHPRAGGEHLVEVEPVARHVGSSPRGRGTRARRTQTTIARRFIPARAGNTTAFRRSRGRPGRFIPARAGNTLLATD